MYRLQDKFKFPLERIKKKRENQINWRKGKKVTFLMMTKLIESKHVFTFLQGTVCIGTLFIRLTALGAY